LKIEEFSPNQYQYITGYCEIYSTIELDWLPLTVLQPVIFRIVILHPLYAHVI